LPARWCARNTHVFRARSKPSQERSIPEERVAPQSFARQLPKRTISFFLFAVGHNSLD
jgi:hypothetical protein